MMALALPLFPVLVACALLPLRGRPVALGPVAMAGLLAMLGLGAWAAVAEPATTWRWSPAIELGVAVEGFARVMVVLVPLIALPIVVFAAATALPDSFSPASTHRVTGRAPGSTRFS